MSGSRDANLAALEFSDQLRPMRWRRFSMVFQGAMNALNPVKTVGWQIAEAIRQHDPQVAADEAVARAGHLLETVGIGRDRAGDYPHEFSGGMRQRAMIALALACGPGLVVADGADHRPRCDDPGSDHRPAPLAAGRDGDQPGVITHDLGVVAESCLPAAVMYGGVIAEQGTIAEVFPAPTAPLYPPAARRFPGHRPARPAPAPIPGTPPRLDEIPPGCRFAPRCPQAFERCHVERPPCYPLGLAGRRPASWWSAPGRASNA